MSELRKIDPQERGIAVQQISNNLDLIQKLVRTNVELANQYGITFTIPEIGRASSTWYVPPKPDDVDIEGTDWKESYYDEEYDWNGEVSGWKNSSMFC